jgi:hypothetical protein
MLGVGANVLLTQPKMQTLTAAEKRAPKTAKSAGFRALSARSPEHRRISSHENRTPTSLVLGENCAPMTTACPCFGRNENCRLCDGSGMVSSAVEGKVVRSTLSAQTSYYTGQSDAQKRVEAEEMQRRESYLAATRRREEAAREAQTPAGKQALKLMAERNAKLAAEQAAHDAAQVAKSAAKSIAYWNKRWGKG